MSEGDLGASCSFWSGRGEGAERLEGDTRRHTQTHTQALIPIHGRRTDACERASRSGTCTDGMLECAVCTKYVVPQQGMHLGVMRQLISIHVRMLPRERRLLSGYEQMRRQASQEEDKEKRKTAFPILTRLCLIRPCGSRLDMQPPPG